MAVSVVCLQSATRRGNEAQINFVRPGLNLKIVGASIAADGTIKARVQVTDSKGLGLDRLGVTSPGAVSISLIVATIPKGQTQYIAYTTRAQKSPINGVTAIQAGTDSGGVWTPVSDGVYDYAFATKAPSGYDKTATHSIGAYASRTLTDFDMGTNYADTVYNFVPDGSPVKVVRDVIRSQSCNRCHDQMAFHGGPRRSIELCVLCHQPQSVDPDTGNSIDMVVMTHKIHAANTLPSVKAGTPYQIIGHNQEVSDYSSVVFPADVRRCTVCHEQNTGATQADAYLKGNRTACGACHDDVNFATGANHDDLPQISDNQCTTCHIKQGELDFDLSILGTHAIPTESRMLPGTVFQILAVDNTAPGKAPVVTFTVKDKSGKPIDAKTLSGLNLYMYGPNADVSTYVRDDARTAGGPGDGRYFWTMSQPLPASAKGSYSIGIEGRRDIVLLPGTVKQQTVRDFGKNQQMAFSVDGTKVQPRRTVVATEKCNFCHGSISFHGGNRNTTEQCVICHNPTMTSGGAAAETIDFRTFIHKVHTGEELERPYVFGTTNFQEVRYPGDRRSCGQCHVNGSEQLPTPGTLSVNDPKGLINPAPPTTAACTACHGSYDAASHALTNISKIGESCATCHGPNSEFSVTSVHAH